MNNNISYEEALAIVQGHHRSDPFRTKSGAPAVEKTILDLPTCPDCKAESYAEKWGRELNIVDLTSRVEKPVPLPTMDSNYDLVYCPAFCSICGRMWVRKAFLAKV